MTRRKALWMPMTSITVVTHHPQIHPAIATAITPRVAPIAQSGLVVIIVIVLILMHPNSTIVLHPIDTAHAHVPVVRLGLPLAIQGLPAVVAQVAAVYALGLSARLSARCCLQH
jgi:hypothetical protein